MVKIQGSFYSVDVELSEDDQPLIQFLIYFKDRVEYKATIIEFDELEYDLMAFLEEHDISLTPNKMEDLLTELELKFYRLQDEIKKTIQTRKKKTFQLLNSVGSKRQSEDYRIVLMGLPSSGKTAIYDVIFEGMLPHKTKTLTPTLTRLDHTIQLSSPRKSNSLQLHSNNHKNSENVSNFFTGLDSLQGRYGQNLVISEIGGELLINGDVRKNPSKYFKDASCLLYVFDAYDMENYDEAKNFLYESIELFRKNTEFPYTINSSRSRIFCFIHKMDHFSEKEEKFHSLVTFLKDSSNPYSSEITFLATSIFDSSIFGAWIRVIQSILPKSSKLNYYAQELKDNLGLYLTIVIEKRTGLPICSSKTLLDDAALVGSTNRILITIEKALEEFRLSNLKSFRIETENGILDVRHFDRYYILMMLYPPEINVDTSSAIEKINNFMNIMRTTI